MIASIYLGFALNDGRMSALNVECAGMILFGVTAVTALSENSAKLLAAGYVGHGLGRDPRWPGSRYDDAMVVRAAMREL